MSDDDVVEGLIEGAYAAALDETLWPDWTWRATKFLGGVSGSFYVLDDAGGALHQTILHDDMKVVERYVDEGIYRFDPQRPYISNIDRPHVYEDLNHVDESDQSTKEYISWAASNGNLRHYCTMAAKIGQDDIVALLSIHRAVADGPTPQMNRLIMESVLPEFRRAASLGFLHAEKLTAAYWDGLLAVRPEPCGLLAESGRILRTTPRLEQLFDAADGLSAANGRLLCKEPNSNALLEKVIGDAAATSAARSGTCRLVRPSGKPDYVVTAHSLSRRFRVLAPAEAAVLITVVDPADRRTSLNISAYAAFNLTSREADVAALLMIGHSIESLAETLKISVATARIHMHRIFAKTGTGRQSELVRLLARIA